MGGGTVTLRALIREYLFVSLFRACAESLASENASRLAAMQRADKNIDELLVHTPYESLQAEHVEIVPSLQAHDPLLRHIALMLQAAIEGEGLAGQLYAEALADALVLHFLRRYAAARPALGEETGGLTPYKLRHTITYIQAHLEQELSLVTLAAVGQTSPAHFARLFKHATGLAPHQYVIVCRMEQAKRLLAETNMPLIEIGPQVGCADQSHFSALFRKHVALTPKAYRDKTRS
jgi:AraC family transcriptional regulator